MVEVMIFIEKVLYSINNFIVSNKLAICAEPRDVDFTDIFSKIDAMFSWNILIKTDNEKINLGSYFEKWIFFLYVLYVSS